MSEHATRELYLSIANRDLGALARAIGRGADMDSRPESGLGALCRAVFCDWPEGVAMLARRGARLDGGESSERPLHLACSEGRLECLNALLRAKAPLDALDDWGRTPLIHAARAGRDDCAKALVQAGADLDARCVRGQTAAMHALRAGAIEQLWLLIGLGASTEILDEDGRDLSAIARLLSRPELGPLIQAARDRREIGRAALDAPAPRPTPRL